MDCTRTQRVLSHTATAGAFLVCLAIAGGFGSVRDTALRSADVTPAASPPTWTTSSDATTEVELAAAPSPPAESADAAPTRDTASVPTGTASRLSDTASAPVETAAAPAAAATPAAVAAIETVASATVADLPPPIEVASLGLAATGIAEPPLAGTGIDMVGLWAPDAGACSMRSFRQGLLPTIINTEGAWAGEAFCMFKTRQPTDSGWRVLAECSSGKDHWTTQVRLSLKGERLVWESKRGRQVYTRCGRDLRMAGGP